MQNAAKAMVELLLFCAGSQRFTLSGERVNPRSVPVTHEPDSDKLKTQRRAKLLTAGRGCLSLFKAPPFAKKKKEYYMCNSDYPKKTTTLHIKGVVQNHKR